VSSPGSFSVSVGASGELHGFTVQLLESSRCRLRARSITLGQATVVILRVGELDDMLERMNDVRYSSTNAANNNNNNTAGATTASTTSASGSGTSQMTPSPFSPRQHELIYRYATEENNDDTTTTTTASHMDMHTSHAKETNTLFVVVGSDDGYSETTLLRIAALVSELCLFLNIDPERGGPNAPLLRQLLLYIESRLAQYDISLLCQTIEWLLHPAIIATGFTSSNSTTLLDELAQQSYLQDADVSQVPNYIAVLFGHKLVLETTPNWNEEAAKVSSLDRLPLHDSDRYLAYFITCAFFSVPIQRNCYEVSYRERQLCTLEQQLRRFGIHRYNVNRLAAQEAIKKYTIALRQEGVGEYNRASFFEQAYKELVTLMSSQSSKNNSDETSRIVQNEYHHMDLDISSVEGKTFQIDNVCFRNSNVVGAMQLRWITATGSHMRQSVDHADDSYYIRNVCPFGYGMCLLFLPPRNVRDIPRSRWLPKVSEIQEGGDERALRQLSQDVLGSMEISFNRFQWLFSPPVEAYEIPGLMHFVAIDRRNNGGVVASFHHMRHQKPQNVQNAVSSLKRLIAMNISRSHTFLHSGYSEGLWGHFGMQFFYCISAIDGSAITTTTTASSPAVNTTSTERTMRKKPIFMFRSDVSQQTKGATTEVETPQPSLYEDSGTTETPRTGTSDSLFGSLDAERKLPSAILPHLVLRPMLISDFMSDEPVSFRVLEVYAVFVGTMSPAEVCREVEKLLRSRVLPFWGTN
ncbi:uncharacterized protein TM35_000441770, partial [Trypanosoma theileri]